MNNPISITTCFCDADGRGGGQLRALVEFLRQEPHNTTMQSFELLSARCRYRASAPEMDHWPPHAQVVVKPFHAASDVAKTPTTS